MARASLSTRYSLIRHSHLYLLAVLLNARGAQAGEAMTIDRLLPRQEFLDREGVARAGLFEAQEAAAHGGNHLGLPTDHPALGVARWQVRNSQRAAIRSDDVLDARTYLIGHSTLVLVLTRPGERLAVRV